MRITGLDLAEFTRITDKISAEHYGGNVIVHQDGRDLGNRRCQARLSVRDSYAHGARTSWRGRHGRIASWHAYRDVLSELFRQYPNARVEASRLGVTYRGLADFLAKYPDTAYVNVGSQMQPAYMPDLSV